MAQIVMITYYVTSSRLYSYLFCFCAWIIIFYRFFIPASFIFWNFLSVLHPRTLLHLHASLSSFFSFLIYYVPYSISVYLSWVTCYISWSLASTVYRREHRHNIGISGCLDCSQRVASHRTLRHLVLRWWELLCSCQLSSGSRSAVMTVCVVQSVTSMIVMANDLWLIIYLSYHYSYFFRRINRKHFPAFCRDVHTIWWIRMMMRMMKGSMNLHEFVIVFQFNLFSVCFYFLFLHFCLQHPCLSVFRGGGGVPTT